MSQWKERSQPSVSSGPLGRTCIWLTASLTSQTPRCADRRKGTSCSNMDRGGASLPSNLLTAHQEIPRLVSLLRQLVLDAQVAFIAEGAKNIVVEIWDEISRALNVKPIEVCPSSRCPRRRPRLCWVSWKHAVDHSSVQRAKGVDVLDFQRCEKGRRATAWISPGWSRTADSPLPPFVPPCLREPLRTPTGCAPCDQQAVAQWERDKFKFPPYHCLWQHGLTRAETWRCPDADERERLLGFRPGHSRPAC